MKHFVRVMHCSKVKLNREKVGLQRQRRGHLRGKKSKELPVIVVKPKMLRKKADLVGESFSVWNGGTLARFHLPRDDGLLSESQTDVAQLSSK